MRARNREINIFNMSLLDILTGMLGAFLFLMLGLVPYYSKAISGTVISQEDKKKLDDMKKLLEKGLKGPLSPEEAEQIRQQLDHLTQENDRLATQNDQLNKDLNETKDQLTQTSDQKDYWASQRAQLTIVSQWDSADVDVDVMVLAPDGTIYGPKKGVRVLGKEEHISGNDSAGKATDGTPYKYAYEVLTVPLYGDGDYLVFYGVPPNAPPQSIYGYWSFIDGTYKGKSEGMRVFNGGGLWGSNSTKAKSGGLYAWTVFSYQSTDANVTQKALPPSLPPGLQSPPP
jgi:hypothetical protein